MPTTSFQTDQLTTAFAGRYRIERELGAGGAAVVALGEPRVLREKLGR